MDQAASTNNKKNTGELIKEFFVAWLYIFLYALRGAKFVCFDFWIVSFNYLSYHLDKAYQRMTNPEIAKQEAIFSEEEVDAAYYRTKTEKKKRVKQYKYSKSTMAKYMKMKAAFEQDLQAAGATRSKYPNVYRFTVRNVKVDGKIITGTMSGFSKLDINSFLVNEGYEVYNIETSEFINFVYKDSAIFGRKMSTKDLVFWLTQLATYIRVGITLNEAMRILASQMDKDKAQQRMFRAICYELSLGESFSNALQKQGNYFPALLINMIKAAEAAGNLQETLDDMADYYTEVEHTRKEMIGALTYPTILMGFSIIIVIFILTYVVPRFTDIYESSGIEINGMTAFIIMLSDFLKKNAITMILLFVLVVIVLYFLYKHLKAFRTPVQIFLMHIPVIKDVIIFKEVTIFSKTFSSLLRNNVYITESVDILSKITSNEVYKAILYKTINNIMKGEKISSAFEDHWAVPDVAYYMIVTGESTGQLAEIMAKVSEYYQEMHKTIVNTLKSFIEPIMIIFLAIIVGFIIIATIVPMFSMYGEIM